VLIGAIHDVAELNLYGSAGLVLVNYDSARLGTRKPPTPQYSIGVGWAAVDFELDVLGGASDFLLFDDRNHRRLRYMSGCHSSASTLMGEVPGLSDCADFVHRCMLSACQNQVLEKAALDGG
jgi:hypothetical protein